MKKTSRNFVFLTILLTTFIAIQFPQKESAQTITPEIASIKTITTTDNAIPEQPIEETSSTNQFENDFIEYPFENLSETSVSDNKSAVNLKATPAATPYHATAYCLNGRTATGGSVRRGIIAADPRVLPLGTRVEISAGAWSGTYTVADTGGAVKGRKIDVWVPNLSEARRFGRRTVHIKVLGKN